MDNQEEMLESLETVEKEIKKIYEKYRQKAEKERAKVNDVYVTVKGEKCYTEADINAWYEGDYISCSQSDKYIEKLMKKREKAGLKDYLTKSEHVCKYLDGILYNLESEIEDIKYRNEKKEGVI